MRKLITSILMVFVLAMAGTLQAQGFNETFDSQATFNANWGTYGTLPWAHNVSGGSLNVTSGLLEALTPGFSPSVPNGFVRTTTLADSWETSAIVTTNFDSLYESSVFITALAGADSLSLGLYDQLGATGPVVRFGINGVWQDSVATLTGTTELTIKSDGSQLGFYADGELIGANPFAAGTLNAVAAWVGGAPQFDLAAFQANKIEYVTSFESVSAGSLDGPAVPSNGNGNNVPDNGTSLLLLCFTSGLLVYARSRVA